MSKATKGISFLNPVDVEEGYLNHCADYAIDHGIKHFELIGPTHSPVKGNIDGMIFFRKYAQFNGGKDAEYIRYCERVVNAALEKVSAHGIKSYYWHHELEVPLGFDEVYPEIHNADGDVEVTHPLIKDFLVNKIEDFFYTYPKMSGIVLTLHETRIPLLKLKNQKLGKVERVKYVTKIIYDTCTRLGKELIVRPFASMASDYDAFMEAYEQISHELVVCDKWTQYDWSLVLPHNAFFNKIKYNPLVVETDIFGEYFGKGFLPIMLKKHITEKVEYCEKYNPKGYVSRIDRGGFIPFGTPNEVNLEIMDAALDERDIDEAIDAFFRREYGECWEAVKEAMEGTEELQVEAMFANGYPFHFLSVFPRISSMKLHYRVFRDGFKRNPNSWDYPEGFTNPDPDTVLATMQGAIDKSAAKLAIIKGLEGKLDEKKYYSLYMRFMNLWLVARIWRELTRIYIGLARYFDGKGEGNLDEVYDAIEKMRAIDAEGYETLGRDFYCEALSYANYKDMPRRSIVHYMDRELKYAIDTEVREYRELMAEGLYDFVIAGGFSEGHNLGAEINFSFPMEMPDGICRTAGSERGKFWSVLKAHGWLAYDVAVKGGVPNTLIISGKGQEGNFSFTLDVDGDVTRHAVSGEGILDCVYTFTPDADKTSVRVKIERNSEYMPYIYTLKVKN